MHHPGSVTSFRRHLPRPRRWFHRKRAEFRARKVITSRTQVTPEWLTDALRRNGYLPHGRVLNIEFLETAVLLTSEFAYLHVTYSKPVTLPDRLFLKYLRQGVGAKWAESHRREVQFYETAASMPMPLSAQVLDEQHSDDWTRGHLLFVDLTTTHYRHWDLTPEQQQSACRSVTECLAQFHGQWWQHPLLGTMFAPFPRADFVRTELERTQSQLPLFFIQMKDVLSEPQRAAYARIAEPEVWANLWQWIETRENLTLEHGQPHLTNFMFPRDSSPLTAVLIDWQSYHVGLGAYDLGYLFVWFIDEATRTNAERDLLTLYYRTLCQAGVTNYSYAQLELDYRWGIVWLWWQVLKLGVEAERWDAVPERLEITWRAMQNWKCVELLKENVRNAESKL